MHYIYNANMQFITVLIHVLGVIHLVRTHKIIFLTQLIFSAHRTIKMTKCQSLYRPLQCDLGARSYRLLHSRQCQTQPSPVLNLYLYFYSKGQTHPRSCAQRTCSVIIPNCLLWTSTAQFCPIGLCVPKRVLVVASCDAKMFEGVGTKIVKSYRLWFGCKPRKQLQGFKASAACISAYIVYPSSSKFLRMAKLSIASC